MSASHANAGRAERESLPRDPKQRERYARAALPYIPRLLGAIDRNRYRATYGCLDRQYWHYRTADFPSEMYQEGALALALVATYPFPGSRWHDEPQLRELAIAALRFAARSCHRDGSCDDYYPFERALGAAVFSLQAATRTYEVLNLDDGELLGWFGRRARWLMRHDESGRLANHQALAAVGLLRVAQLTGSEACRRGAERRLERVLAWQSDEGWFEEYGGADPGYQTITIDCLADYLCRTGRGDLKRPLERAVAFARLFMHPDGSYGGEYGSRGTCHFYPRGMELLASENTDAADLADGFLQSLARGTAAGFDDDRMFAHRLVNLFEAYQVWSPGRARPRDGGRDDFAIGRYLPQAGMLIRRTAARCTIVSAYRGGTFKHFSERGRPASDAGLLVETDRGRVAVSQRHERRRKVDIDDSPSEKQMAYRMSVRGPLHYCRFELMTPVKAVLLRMVMLTIGRWSRSMVRRLLQRRLIDDRQRAPITLKRQFDVPRGPGGPSLRVTDTIELRSPSARVRRMCFACDIEAAYTAAAGVYQPSSLGPWTDLQPYVDELNERRRVTIVREFD